MTVQIVNKVGRPRIQLDEEQIITLAKIFCTMKEIAAVMKCSVDTLERNFTDIIKRRREGGKITLRRYMWKSAEKGNVTMLIWLSKQILGMREPKTDEIQEPVNHVIQMIDYSIYKKEIDEKRERDLKEKA